MNKSSSCRRDRTRAPERIENKARRVNLKCKRKRNIIKKAIELNKMLEMSVYMVLFDRDTGKYFQYASGDARVGHFNLEKVRMELDQLRDVGKELRCFDDDDFERLRIPRPGERDEERAKHENIDEIRPPAKRQCNAGLKESIEATKSSLFVSTEIRANDIVQ